MNVKEVVDRIVAACDTPPLEKTCDLLIVGDWDAQVNGIATTFIATVDVIRDAISKGANLIITHEPTYFTGSERTDWLEGDAVFESKRKLIEDNRVNIWRFHDHMHIVKPDMIYAGLDRELGWGQFALPGEKHCYAIPATTVEELSVFLKEKLDVKAAQIVGQKDARVERVGVLVGGASLGLGSERMPMELMRSEALDVLVCGEIVEWTTCVYVRDASQLGLNKSMIVLGHDRSEEVGMKYLPEWLADVLPGIPVWFVEAGEPFDYL